MEVHIQNNPNQQNETPQNEIKQFIDGRYISACESAWRTFKFPIQGHGPVVGRLAIHLEDHHSITFDPATNNLIDIITRNSNTTLMAWFNLNQIDPDARQYLYTQIPNYYTFDKETREWKKRRKPDLKLVSRIFGVHAKDQERFALRLLLNNVPGATSFQDLKIYNQETFNTFHEAATARGLIENSNEAIICLNEAYLITTSVQKFREFFCSFIINCTADITIIWNEFKNKLSEDFLYHLRIAMDDMQIGFSHEINLFGLIEIEKLLILDGFNLNNFPGLPQLTNQIKADLQNRYQYLLNHTIALHQTYDESNRIILENLPLLNNEQLRFFNTITAEHHPSNLENFLFIIR
jgi:hypothetical protein